MESYRTSVNLLGSVSFETIVKRFVIAKHLLEMKNIKCCYKTLNECSRHNANKSDPGHGTQKNDDK